MTAHAHKLIDETAREMAASVYEELMKKNDWYARWRAKNPDAGPKALQYRFVMKVYPTLLENARAILAGMLNTSPDERLRETIAEALLLDNTLVAGRRH